MFMKIFLIIFNLIYIKSIVECDSTYACPDGKTCCWLGTSWGCCGIANAACCPDNSHCVLNKILV